MKSINIYLAFNGNCAEAMEFYKNAIGGELQIMKFEGSPVPVPEEFKNKILHATLVVGNYFIMASDNMPGQESRFGNNFTINLNCDSREEVDTFFNKLSQGGQVIMALQDTFWNSYYGMLIDKFGVGWMFNFEKQAS